MDERNELIVLMRPTVLKTPEAAAVKAMSEQSNLPGIDLAKDEEERLTEKYRDLVEELRRKQALRQLQRIRICLYCQRRPSGATVALITVGHRTTSCRPWDRPRPGRR